MDELIASIAAHGVLQSLVVAPVAGDKFEVLAGGRRLAALKALAKRRCIAKAHPVPVMVRDDAGEEASLAENVVRIALHPADQVEAFARLVESGVGADAVAARFGCSERLVRQRLALAAVSPALMQVYRDADMTLAQVEAFTVTSDHARHEAAWASLSYNRDPYMIRRALTQAVVPGRDRRVIFVGLDAYEEAGGAVTRDLFSSADECWVEDVALLDRLVLTKLVTLADEIRLEGWRWVEAAIDIPFAHGLRRAYPGPVDLQSDDTDATFAPEVIARGGVFVGVAHDGTVRVERGFIRLEDEPSADPSDEVDGGGGDPDMDSADSDMDEDEGAPILPDRLAANLSAHRTMALRDALGDDPDVALVALTHAPVAQAFPDGRYDPASCLAIHFDTPAVGQYASDVDGGRAARAVAARHAAWAAQVPRNADALWHWIVALDRDSRDSLLAHVVSLTVTALTMRAAQRTRALDTADHIADALELDMSRSWTVSVEGFLGRVTKSAILQAVREGVSEIAAERLTGLRKPEMARWPPRRSVSSPIPTGSRPRSEPPCRSRSYRDPSPSPSRPSRTRRLASTPCRLIGAAPSRGSTSTHASHFLGCSTRINSSDEKR